MSDHTALTDWLARYERAWRTAGTDGLGELFTADAVYSMSPYEKRHRGLAAIAELWEAERQSADEDFTMGTEVVAVEGDVGVVRVEVDYRDAPVREYRDIWVVTLGDDGRCREFEEWPFWPEQGHRPDKSD